MKITIKNWNKFQHYKNRKPPWIKLYRDLLDNPDWHSLSDFASKLLIEIWLVSSESEEQGTIDIDSTALAWRLRIETKVKSVEKALQELEGKGFVTIDSNPLAGCKHVAIPETEREEERETKKEGEKETKVNPFKAWTDNEFKEEIRKGIETGIMDDTQAKLFYNYWTEPDSKGKEKYKKQQTWSTKGRMTTWASNGYNTNRNTAAENACRTEEDELRMEQKGK